MNGRYRHTASRIRQESAALERVVKRAQRALSMAKARPEDQDFCLDSAALNLHDFYTGLERAFYHIASSIDETVPKGSEWQRNFTKFAQR